MLAPWVARNAALFGQPIATTTHGGYTLLLGHNPVYYREVVSGPPGAVWDGRSLGAWQRSLEEELAAAGVSPSDETARDAWFGASARKIVLDEPGMAVRSGMTLLGRFWAVAPSSIATRPCPVSSFGASRRGMSSCLSQRLSGWSSVCERGIRLANRRYSHCWCFRRCTSCIGPTNGCERRWFPCWHAWRRRDSSRLSGGYAEESRSGVVPRTPHEERVDGSDPNANAPVRKRHQRRSRTGASHREVPATAVSVSLRAARRRAGDFPRAATGGRARVGTLAILAHADRRRAAIAARSAPTATRPVSRGRGRRQNRTTRQPRSGQQQHRTSPSQHD